MNLTDSMLSGAAPLARELLLASLPEPEACRHVFSRRFRRRMNALIRRQKHPVACRAAQRAAAILLAALIGAGAWLALDANARAACFRWLKERNKTDTVYRFRGEDVKNDRIYRPAWLPEGYEEQSILLNPGMTTITYKNKSGRVFHIVCMPMQQGTEIGIESDTATEEQVRINGNAGTLYLESQQDKNSALVWFDEKANLSFTISASLRKRDILHMARSVSSSDVTK